MPHACHREGLHGASRAATTREVEESRHLPSERLAEQHVGVEVAAVVEHAEDFQNIAIAIDIIVERLLLCLGHIRTEDGDLKVPVQVTYEVGKAADDVSEGDG